MRSDYIRGCLPRTTKVGDGTFRVFGDPGTDTELIPESDYDKWSDDNGQQGNNLTSYHWHTIDQAQQGSCCGAMGAGILMLGREQAGLRRIVLSQASIYALGNDGRDQGMAIDTCLSILMKTGACPISVIGQYDWQGYHRGTWPFDWKQKAKPFKLLEAWDAPTLQHCYSGIFKGFAVGYGCDGHAYIMMGRKKKSGNYGLNSWGPGWGKNGIGQWRSDRETERGIRTFGAWILRVATDPVDDGDVPKMVRANA